MKRKTPRQYSLCKFNPEPHTHKFWEKYYPKDMIYGHHIYLGEIPNMPGHCVLISHKTGKTYSCYHTENFKEIPEDET